MEFVLLYAICKKPGRVGMASSTLEVTHFCPAIANGIPTWVCFWHSWELAKWVPASMMDASHLELSVKPTVPYYGP